MEQYWRFINADVEELYDGYCGRRRLVQKASLIELGWNSPRNQDAHERLNNRHGALRAAPALTISSMR
jgi:hypothetical protein